MAGLNARLARTAAAEADITQQNNKIFVIYHLYRLVLSLILLISYYYRTPTSPLGVLDETMFIQICLFYIGLNILTLLLPDRKSNQPTEIRVLINFSIVVLDILLLTLLSYTCGGIRSGMAPLLIVPISAGSLMFGTRLGIFYAAIGTISSIYTEIYLYFSLPNAESYYVQAGLLGLILFVTSLVLQYLGQRIRQKELINRQQAASIQSLQMINQQIIARMQTGIIVIDANAHILNCNESACRLLGQQLNNPDSLQSMLLPPQLKEHLESWKQSPQIRPEPIQITPASPPILANFSFLSSSTEPNILIFLEDYAQLSSRAQHLKLMALGRLTASIAHEIRNPLGAISHACQLLSESDHNNQEDQRLLSIIDTHCERVNTIIESILEHSRLRQHVPEKFALKGWLEGFIQRFQNSYSESIHCELSGDAPDLMIRFTAGQLEQLLTNLCDNALRYSEKATGQKSILLRYRSQGESGYPQIDVIDEGPGVPENQTEQVFEPFFTTEQGGTGLGLFICKEICEANQARLYFCRTADNKSCFRIQFSHPERNIT